jgi:hypothetical protein
MSKIKKSTKIKKPKVYVGCAINNLHPDVKAPFLEMINDVKDKLRDHFEILDFLGTASGSPKDTYRQDIVRCVKRADYMVAFCDYPSTGLGYEMATALELRGIPVLALAHKKSNVSRLVLGIHGEGKEFLFARYTSIDGLPAYIRRLLLSHLAVEVARKSGKAIIIPK